MTAYRFSLGLALVAVSACAQIPQGPGVTVAPAPVASAPVYRTLPAAPQVLPPRQSTYIPPAALPAPPPAQVYAARPPAQPVYLPPAPAYRAPAAQVAPPAPIRQTVQAPLPAPTRIAALPASRPATASVGGSFQILDSDEYDSAPRASSAPAVLPDAIADAVRGATLPSSLPVNQSFRPAPAIEIIEESEFAQASTTPRQPNTAHRGPQVRTFGSAEPFSISTGTSGKPYHAASTPPSIEYHIPHIPQEEPLWCWAAAAQQAIGWVNNGRAPAQCAIVALAHGLDVKECCSDREGICARTGEIPAIATLVERFGGEATELATVPRDPETIYEYLRNGDTLLIRLRPAPHDEAVGIRHMIVVRGIEWLRLPNNRLQATLLYNDPLGSGERAVDFDEIEGFFEQALVVRRKG